MRALCLSLVLALAGCGFTTHGDQAPGGRRWIITVDNSLGLAPAELAVALDEGAAGTKVGSVNPSTVPAGATVEAVFDVPPGTGWAIFVNPGTPNAGPLITATDVPSSAVGKLPITIKVMPDGEAGSEMNGLLPGYFGN